MVRSWPCRGGAFARIATSRRCRDRNPFWPSPLPNSPSSSVGRGVLRAVPPGGGWDGLAARGAGWRLVVESLRPITQMMWASADAPKRARFLRHLRPFWDVHRHRLAPSVADRIEALVASGQLRFEAGKMARVSATESGVAVEWRPRGSDELKMLHVARMINCTGPQGDLLRSSDPLVRRMLAARRIRPDALRLGLDIDREGHVIDGHGRASEHIWAIGPMTRGDLWEVVAVPDIRVQVSALARRLVNAHWIAGEGL